MKKLSNTNRHGECLSCGKNLDYVSYQGFENLDYGCDCFTVAEVGSIGGVTSWIVGFKEDPLYRIIAWGCVQTIIFSLPTRDHPVVYKFPKEVQGKLIQLWESIKAQKWGDDFDLEIALYKLFEDGNNILKEIYSSIITIATNDEVIQYESTEQERVGIYYYGVDVKREFDNVMTIYKVADVSLISLQIQLITTTNQKHTGMKQQSTRTLVVSCVVTLSSMQLKRELLILCHQSYSRIDSHKGQVVRI